MNKITKKLLLFSFFIIAFSAIYFGPDIYSMWPRIYPFEVSIDNDSVVDIIQKDIYWFFGNPPKEPFSSTHLSSYYLNKDNFFYVLRVSGKTVGFIIYKKKDQDTGTISLIGVNRDYRSKKYGQKLLDFACHDLAKLGCRRVVLFTRPTNESSQKLYKNMGFKETSRDDNYVYFEKDLTNL